MRPTYLQEEKAFYRVDKRLTKEDVIEIVKEEIAENGGGGEPVEVTIADVTGLQAELDSKADTSDIPDVSGFATTSALTSGLAGKANTTHTHVISDIAELQAELDSKADAEA